MTKRVGRAVTAQGKTNPTNVTTLKEDQVKVEREEKEALEVFIAHRAATCEECEKHLERKTVTAHVGETGTRCLACAGLDHLVFLRRGDPALTRRARKHSTTWAVVMKWKPRLQRYVRRGLLVEAQGLEKARAECLADREVRARQRVRAYERREAIDRQYQDQFAARVQTLFPGCPTRRAQAIAAEACGEYSARLKQAVPASALDPEVVRLAVTAHIRWHETKYYELLSRGYEGPEAYAAVREVVREVLQQWRARS